MCTWVLLIKYKILNSPNNKNILKGTDNLSEATWNWKIDTKLESKLQLNGNYHLKKKKERMDFISKFGNQKMFNFQLFFRFQMQ